MSFKSQTVLGCHESCPQWAEGKPFQPFPGIERVWNALQASPSATAGGVEIPGHTESFVLYFGNEAIQEVIVN